MARTQSTEKRLPIITKVYFINCKDKNLYVARSGKKEPFVAEYPAEIGAISNQA